MESSKALFQETTDKLQELPEPLLQEVYDFVTFLWTRYQQTGQSYPGRQEDLSPEEMTQISASGGAFDWLFDPAEDDLYTDDDGEAV